MGLTKPTKAYQYVLYGLMYLAGPMLFLLLMAWIDQPYLLDDAYRVQPSAYVVSFSDEPPASGWQDPAVDGLPVRSEDDPFTSVWYRFEVKKTDPVPAIYFPLPLASLDIWYQQERMHLLGSMAEPLPYYSSPLLLPFPAVEKGADAAVFYVRVARHDLRSYMPDTYIAPFELARRDFDDLTFALNVAPAGVLIVMAIFGLIVFSLFLVGPRNSAYGWYSLMILLWGLRTAHGLVNEIPVELPLWWALNYLCLSWITVDLIFVNRFFSIPAPRIEQTVVGISVIIFSSLVMIALFLGFESMSAYVMWVLTPWTFVCAIIVTSRYFVALTRNWTYESLSLWLASGVFIGVGIRDILYQYQPQLPLGSDFYLQYVALLLVTLFGWHLIRRFVEALRISDLKTHELDATVAQRTAELERSYAKIAAEEKRRSIEEERTRLMRDMHDGLGGQLVNALALSEQGADKDLQSSLRNALEDLRLVVDSLAPDCDGLSELLASYRHRVSQSLHRAGVNVLWDIDDADRDAGLDPKESLTVLRILQEAVTNAIRHSNCKTVRISLSKVDEGLKLQVTDDGNGIRDRSPGRGLQNMRVRAREIGAQLAIESSSAGTEVSCLLRDGNRESATSEMQQ